MKMQPNMMFCTYQCLLTELDSLGYNNTQICSKFSMFTDIVKLLKFLLDRSPIKVKKKLFLYLFYSGTFTGLIVFLLDISFYTQYPFVYIMISSLCCHNIWYFFSFSICVRRWHFRNYRRRRDANLPVEKKSQADFTKNAPKKSVKQPSLKQLHEKQASVKGSVQALKTADSIGTQRTLRKLYRSRDPAHTTELIQLTRKLSGMTVPEIPIEWRRLIDLYLIEVYYNYFLYM